MASWACLLAAVLAGDPLPDVNASSPADAEAGLTAEPRRDTIIGGETTEPGEFDGVVAVISMTGGLCTGIMVSPRLVLTAAHCIASITQPAHLAVAFGEELGTGPVVSVIDFGTHPDFCPDSDPEVCPNDIFDYGYILIDNVFHDDDPLPKPITDQSEWDAVMHVGASVTIVGFGLDPSDDDGQPGRKRKVETTITRLSPLGYEFRAGGADHDSCAGDSGGPAFVRAPGDDPSNPGPWRLAGITSRGSEPCGSGGYYSVPYPALEWVAEKTDTNLCGDCVTCDCLDVTPPPPAVDGCGCHSEHRTGGSAFTLALLLGVLARRRAAPRPTWA